MSPHLGMDVVYCGNCRNPIVLPHQSPLGIFQSLENQATDEWPASFLCPVCGLEFSCWNATIDDEIQVTIPASLIPDLVRVEYTDVQANSEIRRAIYTTCPKGGDLERERPRLLKRLSGIREILRLDAFPYRQ